MTARYDDAQREQLLELAESTIRTVDALVPPSLNLDQWPAWAQEQRATFVTVHVAGKLNGCIGTLTPRRALADDVAGNAFRAAFADPRFRRVEAADLDELSVHISILGPLEVMEVRDEADLIDRVRVGIDGLVLDDGEHRGTFLPAVWEKLPDPSSFLAHLKRKAGLPVDAWPDALEVFRFEVEEFERHSRKAR